MSPISTNPPRVSHWSGSLAVRLASLCCVLIVPLAWLGIGQYRQIHRQIATTRSEQHGLEYISRALGVLQLSARTGPGAPRAADAAVEARLAELESNAAKMPDLPVAVNGAQTIRQAWNLAERRPDAASFTALGTRIIESVGDVASASTLAFDGQIVAGNIGDALYGEFPLEFERLIAAYRTAEQSPADKAIPVESRIEIAGYLARAEAAGALNDSDIEVALRENPALRDVLERPWLASTSAANALHAILVEAMQGATATPAFTASLRAKRTAFLDATKSHLGALNHALTVLFEQRLAMLDQEDRILTSVLFAGLAVLIGVGVLIVRAAGRSHLEELQRAQREADQLAAELARQEAERALLLTEAQFRAVFERSQMGIALLTGDGTTVESNGALRAIVGEADPALVQQGDKDFAELIGGRRGTYQTERLVERPDETRLWIEVTISPVSVPQPEETAAIAIVQDITERKAVDERLRYAATHDELTGLPNRTEFLRELTAVLANPDICEHHAVLFVDLDGFKLVNDGLGHFAGDKVLAASARRLRAACRPTDLVARFHGDEFAILLRDIDGEKAARAAADRVQRELRTPITVGSQVAIVTSSVGIVTLHAGYDDAEEVLRNADAAMYHAKARGRSHTALFDDAMYQRVASHFRIATELRHALARNQIHVAFQPIVSLTDESTIGLEALLRWDHPEFGSISPTDFIPVAEESEAIIELGRYALQKAVELLTTLDRLHPEIALSSISVNLSVQQLSQGDIVEDVRRTLRASGLEGRRLVLEVTESALMDNAAHAAATFAALRELGVRLSIDDFGTGYSSLRYLNEFPFDVLKIDRSFVRGDDGRLANEPIVTMLMRLAESLRVAVVAEGIETDEQRIKLRDAGCRFGQGFLFSPALEEADLIPWLTTAAERRVRRPRLRVAP